MGRALKAAREAASRKTSSINNVRDPDPPSHTRNDRNEPVWRLPFFIDVTRMDNSLALVEEIGTATDKETGLTASICIPMGGFAYVIQVHSKPVRQYGINLKPVALGVFEMDEKLRKVERLGPPKKPSKKGKRRG